MLLLEVVLKNVVLVLGQTGFDVAARRLLSAGGERGRLGSAEAVVVGGVHGGGGRGGEQENRRVVGCSLDGRAHSYRDGRAPKINRGRRGARDPGA